MKIQLGIIVLIAAGLTLASCSKLQNDSVLATQNCSSCHGTEMNPAPPPDPAGNTATSSPGVGAHQIHLNGSDFAAKVSCSTCHVIPKSTGPAVHPGGPRSVTLVAFSGIAYTQTNTPGTRFYDSTMATITPQPTFNAKTLQCSNTYCHGDFKGGNNFSPTWNITDGSQDSCGTCHGIPPDDATHSGKDLTRKQCYLCHSPMINQEGVIVDDSMHANGTLVLYGRTLSAW